MSVSNATLLSLNGKNLKKLQIEGVTVWEAISGPVKKAFSDCTWAEVSEICKAGLASEFWALGDTKPMVAGASDKILRIIGFDHDPVTDASAYGREKAGITLEMVDLHNTLSNVRIHSSTYEYTSWYNDYGDYHCEMRKTTLPNFMVSQMPADLKEVIVPVDKEYQSSVRFMGWGAIKTISDTLFLPSLNELTGKYSSGAGSEGTQYAYYAAGNSYNKGVSYWTRSPRMTETLWHYISDTYVYNTYVNERKNCFPCMCI